MRTTTIIPLVLALTGCSQSLQLTGGVPTMETQRCAASGGMLDQRGRRGNLMCVHRFVDAGKACASDKDCQGRCLADKPDGSLPQPGEAVPGRCEPDDKTFGCYAEVEGGKAKRSICVD
ncbi:MAG: hypothetical protein J0G94_05450 [Sphingomonadales bacterium]|nr:hypothetical protein [Sphingomonadales bacterium]